MVTKLNTKIHRGGAALMAVFGFFLIFLFSDVTKDSNETVLGTAVAHADIPAGTSCGGPGCCGGCGCAGCGSCAGGCSSDCGGDSGTG